MNKCHSQISWKSEQMRILRLLQFVTVPQPCPVLHDTFKRYWSSVLWSASHYEFVSWLDWSHSFGEKHYRGNNMLYLLHLTREYMYQHDLLLVILILITSLKWYLPGFSIAKLLLYSFYIPDRSESVSPAHTQGEENLALFLLLLMSALGNIV